MFIEFYGDRNFPSYEKEISNGRDWGKINLDMVPGVWGSNGSLDFETGKGLHELPDHYQAVYSKCGSDGFGWK